MSDQYHVAQINIARIRAPLDDASMHGFVSRLDEVNAIADSSAGFVWRLKGEGADATSLRPYDDERIIVNMSVWETPRHLRDYVYRGMHVAVMRDRKQWFERLDDVYYTLWWITAGVIPSVEAAKVRLDHMRSHGATAYAFSFAKIFPPPSATGESLPFGFSDTCPAL